MHLPEGIISKNQVRYGLFKSMPVTDIYSMVIDSIDATYRVFIPEGTKITGLS